LQEAVQGAPPLLGNRRQGPDLARVGNRRSPEWNRLHLIAPRAVSPGSRMPAYAHLFAAGDGRGEALVAYLASLGADTLPERQVQIAAWQPDAREALPPAESRRLFVKLCAPCHGESGRGDGAVAAKLSARPPDWSQAAWRFVPQGVAFEPALARTIRFGLPGLAMAGHECLTDREVIGLVRFVQTLHRAPGAASMPAVPP
jgi:cytochrome c oxidase cbb3-type subunit 2